MRVYHFLPAEHALDDVEKRRIKISEIDSLNDPFELWCSAQPGREARRVLRRWRDDMAERYGLLCFCAAWHNPLLWSHYANQHRGICLGFDLDDNWVKPVTYVKERLSVQLPQTQSDMVQLLYTKYVDWQYEEEWRAWVTLQDRDPMTGYCYFDFGAVLKLRELITGPLCGMPEAVIRAPLRSYGDQVDVIKGRLAFRSFQVVPDRRGFSEWL